MTDADNTILTSKGPDFLALQKLHLHDWNMSDFKNIHQLEISGGISLDMQPCTHIEELFMVSKSYTINTSF